MFSNMKNACVLRRQAAKISSDNRPRGGSEGRVAVGGAVEGMTTRCICTLANGDTCRIALAKMA